MGSRKSSMRSNKSRSDLDLSPDGLDQPDEGVKKLNENRKLILEQKLGGGKLKKWENIDQVIIIPPLPTYYSPTSTPTSCSPPTTLPPKKIFVISPPPYPHILSSPLPLHIFFPSSYPLRNPSPNLTPFPSFHIPPPILHPTSS